MSDYKLWDKFLKEWPLDRVRNMKLEEYSEAGSKDTFTYWLESKLSKYGSIWGGSAFKFGVYSRADTDEKDSDHMRSYSDKYAWYTKDADTPEKAFEITKKKIITVIEYAISGDIEEIDKIALGPAYKWKIAFHYQDRNNPVIISIFKHVVLAELCNEKPDAKRISHYHRKLIERNSQNKDINDYSYELWGLHLGESKKKGNYIPGKDLPLNTIFYGPPGTGKTYFTINQALKIISKSDPTIREELNDLLTGISTDRDKIEETFYQLLNENRICFLTFHPSYTYEDFIHGIRPVLGEGENVSYELKDGPFKKIAEAACSEFGVKKTSYTIPKNARVFKMSLGNSLKSADDDIFTFCQENGYIAHGFGKDINFLFVKDIVSKEEGKRQIKEKLKSIETDDSDDFAAKVIWTFINELKKDDIVIISKGNRKARAIGRILGDYKFLPDEDIPYSHFREVEWIIDDADIPVEQILIKVFSQQTLYELKKNKIIWENLNSYLQRTEVSEIPRNYVMIIDEINRGNIPRIFGELITLIEKDKRLKYKDGSLQGLSITLPGAGDDDKDFGVPSNLYIIGTMNTADRSITTLDVALRRRFSFIPMYPNYEVIEDDFLRSMLETLNKNICKLKDKDHQIGHSFFIDKELADLADVLNEKVLPLLEEYYYGDNKLIKDSFNGIVFPNGNLESNDIGLLRYKEIVD